MRLLHYEQLQPVCPRCFYTQRKAFKLSIIDVSKENNDTIIEAFLLCSNPKCAKEYPVIDGIPVILQYPEQFIQNNINTIESVTFYSKKMKRLAHSFKSSNNNDNSKHQLSAYAWDHYNELAPTGMFNETNTPSSALACLVKGLSLLESTPKAPTLDAGCATGRTTFELANTTKGLTLGIDLNFEMLIAAQQVLRNSKLSFPLKQLAKNYKNYTFDIKFDHSNNVDFWACNATCPPFRHNSFSFINALNLIDILHQPNSFFPMLQHQLKPNGQCLLSTPYDWTNEIPQDFMLEKEEIDYAAIESNFHLKQIAEIKHQPWIVRENLRKKTVYDTHIMAFSLAHASSS